MANIKSAKKDILVSRRNQLRNVAYKSRMKTFVKKALQSIADNSENKTELVQAALRIIDKTASKGVIKKQTASRKKSRLSLAFNKSK
jgi:small subunit ribosomal protein S20